MSDGSDRDDANSFHRISVIGAGTMGHGIAVAFAVGGCSVTLYDADEEALRAARENVRNGVSTLVEHDAVKLDESGPAENAIDYVSSLSSAVADADLVVEAVPEDIDIKVDVLRAVERSAPAGAVIASNTSSLSITELGASMEDPSRVLGTHWFHPPHIVPVVEVVKGDETADRAVRDVSDLLERIGKDPVVVEKDIPGFIGNRIQSAMAHEAWSLLDAGVASAEDIDRAVKGTFGFRLPALGVFEKGDHSGLDIHAKVLTHLLEEIDRGTSPSHTLLDLVDAGHHGSKTGKGVYDWTDVDLGDVNDDRDRQLLSLLDVYRQRERTAPKRHDC